MQTSLWICLASKSLSGLARYGQVLIIVLSAGIIAIFAVSIYVKVLDSEYFKIAERKGIAMEKDGVCICQ